MDARKVIVFLMISITSLFPEEIFKLNYYEWVIGNSFSGSIKVSNYKAIFINEKLAVMTKNNDSQYEISLLSKLTKDNRDLEVKIIDSVKIPNTISEPYELILDSDRLCDLNKYNSRFPNAIFMIKYQGTFRVSQPKIEKIWVVDTKLNKIIEWPKSKGNCNNFQP